MLKFVTRFSLVVRQQTADQPRGNGQTAVDQRTADRVLQDKYGNEGEP
jgi:hypothetical protein